MYNPPGSLMIKDKDGDVEGGGEHVNKYKSPSCSGGEIKKKHTLLLCAKMFNVLWYQPRV